MASPDSLPEESALAPEEERCEVCRYFSEKHGACYRCPITYWIGDENMSIHSYALADSLDWCGEFRSKEEAIAYKLLEERGKDRRG